MYLRRMLGVGGVLLLLTTLNLSAGRSDVADAASRGDKASVRALLAQHADVNAAEADGATALHWAAFRGGWRASTAMPQ
jgi:ankyrin repeat protein